MLEEIAGPLQASLAKILALLAGVFFAWYIVSTLIGYKKLRHIPGPPLAGFTNWWWIKAAISGKGHLALKDACDRYGIEIFSVEEATHLTDLPGSIARISPGMVVTSDLELYRKANANRINDYSRGPWYKAFKMDAERENLFTQLDDEKHSAMRLKLSPGVRTHGRINNAITCLLVNSIQAKTTQSVSQASIKSSWMWST